MKKRVPQTRAEEYLRRKLDNPLYAAAYKHARDHIDRIDSIINTIDARRRELNLTKAELGRRCGIQPEAIRRLLTSESPNPTLSTLVSVSEALGLSVAILPQDPARVGTASSVRTRGQRNTVRRRLNSSPSLRTRK